MIQILHWIKKGLKAFLGSPRAAWYLKILPETPWTACSPLPQLSLLSNPCATATILIT